MNPTEEAISKLRELDRLTVLTILELVRNIQPSDIGMHQDEDADSLDINFPDTIEEIERLVVGEETA